MVIFDVAFSINFIARNYHCYQVAEVAKNAIGITFA